MRCFISINVPEIREELDNIQQKLKVFSGLKASYSKDSHLTLKFLGEISEEKMEHVKKALEKCKKRKFTLEFDRFGMFPNENFIKVLWMGVKPEKEVAEMKKEIDEVLQKDFPKEKNFKAHLTIARVKLIKDRQQFLERLENIDYESKKFKADGFSLMKSTLTDEGAVYEELASYPAL